MTTDEEGKATCKDLPVGVYLVYVEDLADFETITPLLLEFQHGMMKTNCSSMM